MTSVRPSKDRVKVSLDLIGSSWFRICRMALLIKVLKIRTRQVVSLVCKTSRMISKTIPSQVFRALYMVINLKSQATNPKYLKMTTKTTTDQQTIK